MLPATFMCHGHAGRLNFTSGELGVGVNIDKNTLSNEEKKKFDEGWENNAFNQYVSDKISLHRSLPDIRDHEYDQNTYTKI